VGDWVAVKARGARIHGVLPRSTAFVRQAAGKRTKIQVICTNVDLVLIVTSADQDFNLRRIERYLTAVRQSGAEPVVVISKSDLVSDPEAYKAQVETLDADIDVVTTSAKESDGLRDLAPFMPSGKTLVLVGSSGVGKSSLINHLHGAEIQSTKEVRETDGRGRHTTTHRELFLMPNGALMIDTPGMREFTVWAAPEYEDLAAFTDIQELAKSCRFRNCRHDQEPDCAVREAVASGALSPERLQNFKKLQEELASQAALQRKALLLHDHIGN
jgi:ribosome biogenesis GTPase